MLHRFAIFAAALSAVLQQASSATACGGTFCDRGSTVQAQAMAVPPPPMTVDQSGENILFVVADGHVEAHVQIRYQGDPEKFAWLVPMPSVPEVSIGSQLLFDAMLNGTTPVFGVRTTTMNCDGGTETSENTGCGSVEADSSSSGGLAPTENEEANRMIDPIGQTVGSFDVTILQPASTGEVLSWLTDNDFNLSERSEELIEPYVAAGSVFAAIRFVPGAGVKEVHPIVFRYEGTRPAIPIKLTAVAATEDMRIRTFFLGEDRTFPTNFRHVELNMAKLNWPGFGFNYELVVARAVDETGDGHGFVTEYAGSSSAVDPSSVHSAAWNAHVFSALGPMDVMTELQRQGQVECTGGFCVFEHPLLLPLLQRYLPAPPGSNENAFYSCVECVADQIDDQAWDGEAFAADYQQRIIDPGLRARQLLQDNRYLTRMLSMLSPAEMTMDPGFHSRADMPGVSQEHWAERLVPCAGPTTITLPGGRVVEERFGRWVGSSSEMPNAERIELVPLEGQPEVVLDASIQIDAQIAAWNEDAERDGIDDVTGGIANRGAAGGCRVHPGFTQDLPLWGLTLLLVGLRGRRWRDGSTRRV